MEQLGEMPKMVSQNRIQRRAAEQIVDMPGPKVVELAIQVLSGKGSTALGGEECRQRISQRSSFHHSQQGAPEQLSHALAKALDA